VTGHRAADTGVLSARQRRVLEVVSDYWAVHGIAPTVREVARLAGFGTSSAAYQISELEAAGWLTRRPGIPRSLRIVDPPAGERAA
jgi:repressor LexA